MSEIIIRSSDDLVEAFRARKEQLGLSNAEVEAQLLLAGGVYDKYLGPSRTKQLLPQLVDDLMTLFGVELVLRVPELEAKMSARLERRDERAVRPHRRLSKKLLELARAQLMRELSSRGNEARNAKLPREARSSIARAAATSRWRRHRAARKSASLSEVAQA
jgi:hypothetical protein